jgi:hypothetical protein
MHAHLHTEPSLLHAEVVGTDAHALEVDPVFPLHHLLTPQHPLHTYRNWTSLNMRKKKEIVY